MATNGIPVDVRLQSHQLASDGQPNVENVNSSGTLWLKDDRWIVRFAETSNDQEAMTTIKMQPGHLIMFRHGSITMRQTFRLHQESEGTYRLPYGMFQLTTYTEQMERQASDDTWWIEWIYRLSLNGTDAGKFLITLTMKSLTDGVKRA